MVVILSQTIPWWEKRMLLWAARNLSHSDIPEMESRMLETKGKHRST